MANRDARARTENVNASAVTMWMVLGEEGVAGGWSEDRKGVDSSTAASPWSSARGCEGAGDGSRSREGPGML